ncbi:Protein FAR1-RELATED SEQUENCE 2 [Arabidopsis thaliana]|uniref:Protein FAR1-RELATED SEQUENCE n=4 Tax=Arabidopsis TaxID=3701 RepID=A0A178VYC3_ARATH|nr:MULE transposase domain [Arabidopsis thaliana x Arabidopsis arenosa]KAG7642815.1 MULE transposase domain [Arabidopsis suecica]OAP11310.1 FRS2 [Arabidopsis thaliana]KAG7638201.1 MULE transposase domain [Arabidopsis thaliana x Arabidopsis arenosa]KAG7642816.1 MULE transposase domain [Arabidopsis suecica]
MDDEDVEIDLLTKSSNVNVFCEASTSGNVAQCATVSELRNGMDFESKEAAYYFYREYARSVGFGITIKASRRSKRSGKFIDVKIACSRFGTKREKATAINPRSCPKTGCKAGLHMKRKEDEKWVIYNFVKEHNHEICPDDFYVSVRGKNKPAGALAIQKKGLQLALEEEDLKLLLEHFMEMQDKQPGFFYAVDFDSDKHVRNVFWLDAKAKHDYCSFSDVVLFDTFYVRNGYRIPFAPFIGVSHHRQYVLLGCALIGEVSESTYSWLFRTWLKAVGGQAPGVMITDQDKLLSDIVVEVFPDARHIFCLWSVLSKISEMLNPFVSQDDGFMESFRNCVASSWTDEHFERRWSNMIGKFELNENEWVQLLFRDRKKWVPHYFHGICLAGLSGPERSGSIASHFDKYMNSEATFKDFFELYMKFLQYRCDVEAKDDLEYQSKQPTLRSSLAFEKQLSLIYTDAAFKKFQAEVPGVVSCQLQKKREDGTTAIFRIEDFEERQNFFVALNNELLDACCSCHLFEYEGFLCKHAILVLQSADVSRIPSQYILKRWSKKGKNKEDKNDKCATIDNRMARFDDLCRRFVKLGVVASLSDEAYKTALKLLEETVKHCVSMDNSSKFPSEPDKLMTGGSIGLENEGVLDCASKLSKKKKIQKKRKVYCGPEDATNRSEELRQETEQVSSRAPTFENCYIPQANMEEPELGSRATTLGVYYSTQQTNQGFPSISSIQNGYYGHPPTIQAMGNLHSIHERMSQYETQPSMQGAFQGQTGFRGSAIRGCYDIEETLHDMTMGSSQFQGSDSSHPSDHRLSN